MQISQRFVRHISFPFLTRREGYSGFLPKLRELEESQYWPRDRLHDFQMSRLKQLLIHAFENTDYYQKVFEKHDFNPYEFKDPDAFHRLPFLTKNVIRENLDALVAKNYRPNELHRSETGGTTGVKMAFFRDNACLSWKDPGLYRFEKWAGWNFGERLGLVWPAQQDYVGHWTLKARIKNELYLRQVVFPAAIMDEESISSYLDELKRKKPTVIRAFTTPLAEIAKFMNEKGISGIPLKGVITTGEPLYPGQREAISEAFACPVFDSYRSREAGPMAQECEEHNGMHVNAEALYFESVPHDGITLPYKGLGEIVVTDLLNYGMPFIRYRTGDLGRLTEASCPCGRGLPLLKNVSGRATDIFHTPDGKLIPTASLVLYLVDEAPELMGQVQVVQDRLDHLKILMTRDPTPSDRTIEYQRETVKRLFGDSMQVTFELVDEIPREKSGKYLFAKCTLPESSPQV